MTFRVHVRVMPRTGLLDPQGQAVEHALIRSRFCRSRSRSGGPGDRAGRGCRLTG